MKGLDELATGTLHQAGGRNLDSKRTMARTRGDSRNRNRGTEACGERGGPGRHSAGWASEPPFCGDDVGIDARGTRRRVLHPAGPLADWSSCPHLAPPAIAAARHDGHAHIPSSL